MFLKRHKIKNTRKCVNTPGSKGTTKHRKGGPNTKTKKQKDPPIIFGRMQGGFFFYLIPKTKATTTPKKVTTKVIAVKTSIRTSEVFIAAPPVKHDGGVRTTLPRLIVYSL